MAEPEAALPAESNGSDGEGWGESESVPANDAVEHRGEAGLDDAFTDEGHSDGARGAEGPAAYSQWASVGGGGGGADGDYNLEAYVPAETTLGDWLRRELRHRHRPAVAAHDRSRISI